MKKLPIGIQSIKKILCKKEYLYVDKTGFIKKLIDAGTPHYFMSRPRRFGKSLFLNTLEEVFSGNKNLFEGYEIYNSDYSWKKYPVVRFDFSQIASQTPIEFQESLKRTLVESAEFHALSIEAPTIQEGLKALITHLFRKDNTRTVVLVDEYDHAIINRLGSIETAQKNKEILKDFFTTLKSLDEYLKFTFVTGISKFSQVSLFSGPNNLVDITMDPQYAGMMGYTEDEVKKYFQDYIQEIAAERKKHHHTAATEEQILNEIRSWYNGYRFSEGDICVYNPFSTLKFMQNKKPKAYWYSSGTPSFLIDELKKHSESMISLEGATAIEEELMDISRLDKIDLTALMYQTGYFTIKEYNPISKRFLLGLPNEEVRNAFINSLVQNFASITKLKSSEKCVKALEEHQPDFLFKHIELGFASFAYQVFVDAKENTYQGMLLSMLYGMGFDPLSEKATNTGRIDVVLEIPNTIYIMELKLDESSEIALKQIHDKSYFKSYLHKGKKIVIIGANFSSKNRNISDWTAELLSEAGELIKKILPNF